MVGRGGADLTGGGAALLLGGAGGAARGGPRRGSIAVVASVAEEMMEGAALGRTVLDLGRHPDFGLIVEPTNLGVATAQRGRAKLEVTLWGRAVHAAYPQLGVNALAALARLIAHTESLDHPCHPLLGPRTLTPIDAESRPLPSVSVVPGWTRGRFDCRFLPGETPDAMLDLLRLPLAAWGWGSPDGEAAVAGDAPLATVGFASATFSTWVGEDYSVPEVAPCWETPRDHPLVRRALAGVAATGLEPRTTVYEFCTNGSLLAGTLAVPTIGFGVGRQEDAHTVNESVAVEDLARGAAAYTALLDHILERA
ncbi:MAG: hypothetical protein NVSMB65_00600 [Chloroflexota bacterium]